MESFLSKTSLLCVILCVCYIGCSAQNKRRDCGLLQPDTVVQKLYGDSVSQVLFNPRKVKCYLLDGINRYAKASPTKKKDTQRFIAGYPISIVVGPIDLSFYSVVQSLMMSRLNYEFNEYEYKTPFSPYVCYEVSNGVDVVNILFSFNRKSWAVEYKGRLVEAKYSCEAFLLEYFSRLLPQDKYIKSLRGIKNE